MPDSPRVPGPAPQPPPSPAPRLLLPILVAAMVLLAGAWLVLLAPPPAPGPVEALPPERVRFVVGFVGPPDLGEAGRASERVLALNPILRFAVVESDDPPGFVQRLEARADVRYVEPDPELQMVQFAPDDPRYPNQTGPPLLGAPAAWDTARGDLATRLCVVDTGVRRTHQDLAAAYAGGIDLVNGDGDPWDDHGHGTHVAGLGAARIANGVGTAGLGNVALLAVKALDSTGSGTWSRVASGIQWCADSGARAIALALGGSSGSTALLDAVNYAWNRGAVVVAAAGNNGPCADCVMYPARYDNAIATACITLAKDPCAFSAYGPEVDLAAPGVGQDAPFWTGDDAYGRLSGTSMSTGNLAGAAALLAAAHPEWTATQVRAALEQTAEDLGAAGRDTATGWGLARLDRAMAWTGSAAPPPPPPPSPPPPEPSPAPTPAPAPVRSVSLAPEFQSQTTTPKQRVTYTFTLANLGEVSEVVQLTATANATGWGAAVSPAQVTLAPGASATVQLVVKPPGNARPPSAEVRVVALAADGSGIGDTAWATTWVQR